MTKDQNVIQVHHYDPLGYKSSKDVIHHSLEGGGYKRISHDVNNRVA